MVFHILAFKYEQNLTKINRKVFINALNAEGIPVAFGYNRVSYENPTFLKKIAYGVNGCPYNCNLTKTNVNYYRNMCPSAEQLVKEKFIWFYHLGYPTTKKDLDDVINAFEKVFENLENLKEHQEEILEKYKEKALR
jgi:dTDP-4-amino-4,6-dideoxygalactose transaminase